MLSIKDQLGRTVNLQTTPRRIVSVVPSQTELLYALELEDHIVGVTKFCVHPSHYRKTKTIVGGTKNLRLSDIKELSPDLIIANKEENTQEEIMALADKFPVWVSDVKTMDENYKMIRSIGTITGASQRAINLIKVTQKSRFDYHLPTNPLKVAYFIWQKPWMTVGGDTFIHHMIQESGMINAFGHQKRYPEIGIDDIKRSGTELILLSSEPFPFKQKHADQIIKQTGLPCLIVDGEMFSWYGSRPALAYPYFERIFNI